MKSVILFMFSLLAFSITSRSQYLDTTFNHTGFSVVNSGQINALIVLPDNSIVTAGQWSHTFGLLMKYLPDGTLDSSFGINGQVKNYFGDQCQYNSIVRQPDGKFVCTGSFSHVTDSPVIARFTANGTLDPTFGANASGMVRPYSFCAPVTNPSIALQPDGKIVVVGTIYINHNDYLGVARYTPDGILDTTFNHTGIAMAPHTVRLARTVALQPDGKIIAGSQANNFASTGSMALDRFNSDGTADMTFGNQGTVIFNIDSSSILQTVVLQPDGKILAGGSITNFSYFYPYYTRSYFAVARFNNNGSLDNTFGGGQGYDQISVSDTIDMCYGIALMADGKIVATGTGTVGSNGGNYPVRLEIVRLNPDGSLDNTFNGNGKLKTTVTVADGGLAVAIDTARKMIIGGYSYPTTHYNLICRFTNVDPAGVQTITPPATLNTTIYPVPLTNTTTIQYELHSPAAVTINMYDITGRLVKTILNNTQQQIGIHKQQCPTAELPKGVYTVKIISGEGTAAVQVVK